MSRRERKKVEARQRLYKAAIHLFITKGYESTSVQEITDLADMAKATFFNYFPTKEHVLAAYHIEMTNAILNTLTARSISSPAQAVMDALSVFAEWAEKSVSIGRILLRIVFGSDVLASIDQENEKKFYLWFEGQIQNAVRIGEMDSALDVPLFTSLIVAVLSSTAQEWFLSEQSFDLKAALESRIGFLLKSVSIQQQLFGIIKRNK